MATRNRYRVWCFTLNNYSDEDITSLKNNDKIQYLIFGKEIAPKTKTPHLQGYMELFKKVSLKSLKKVLNIPKIHLEKRKGTQLQAIVYCKKDKDFYEQGDRMKPGNRKDIHEIYDMVKSGNTDMEIQETHLESYVKYYKAVDRLRTNVIQEKNKIELSKEFSKVILKEWQLNALNILNNQDSRKILWITDEVGNSGKTFLAKYLVSNYDAFYVMNGKNADISYSYKYQDIVIFDYSRSQEDYINYSIIEQFKNGLIFSPKYESITKIKNNIKVICFSNFEPDTTKLSNDRWHVISL